MKGLTPEALGSADFVLYADIDLAYPQRGEVRGEAMLFRDRELAPDHRYYYRVAAYDQDGYLGGLVQDPEPGLGLAAPDPGGFQGRPRGQDRVAVLESGDRPCKTAPRAGTWRGMSSTASPGTDPGFASHPPRWPPTITRMWRC